jgi:ribosomal protein S18 acetylase RimI-like enzyme
VKLRTVEPHETELCARLGQIVVMSYMTLPGHVDEPDYERELADVAGRAAMPETEVIAAVDDDGTPLGCVTYVPTATSPMAEGLLDGEAAFRMLGVDPSAQGRGVGRALVDACIARAEADERHVMCLHTTPWMTRAHALYESMGFERDPERDWLPVPDVPLWGYRLVLTRS